MKSKILIFSSLLLFFSLGCSAPEPFDLIIRNGNVFDAKTGNFQVQDIGIRGDQIVAMAENLNGQSENEIDASGLTVSPGCKETYVPSVSNSINSGEQ